MQDNISNLRSYQFKSQTNLYPRIGHKIVVFQNFIFIFGGVNLHNDFNTSVLKINCENYQIDIINTKNSYPIEGFSIATFKQVVLLWGGTRPSGNSNDLWMFQNNSFTKIAQKGEIPSPRTYQASTYFANRYMIIYGGFSDKQVFNDWYLLDILSKQWKKLNPSMKLPDNIDPKIVWISGRGILLLTEVYDKQQQKIIYASKLYEFRITNFEKGQLKIQPLDIYNQAESQNQKNQIESCNQFQSRSNPTLCPINSDSTYVAVLGGQRLREVFKDKQVQFYSDMWLINLQTLSYFKATNVKLASKFGSQAIFYKDRLVMVGGISEIAQFSPTLQVIDLIYQKISIQRKLCKACQNLYGLDDFNKTKMVVKCDYQSNPKSFFAGSLVSKIADTIRNPIKAFGLLMDNSLNMNANLISIKIQKKKMNEKYFKNPYSQYLVIQDNSYGFNKQEVVEALISFGHKIQTTTCDNKYEQQLAVRKQFGINLKLASLRLGKSCLYMTNVIQDQLFVGYFSVKNQNSPQFQDRFNCFYYFVAQDGTISSQINRHIINSNVRHLIDLAQEERVQFMKNVSSPSLNPKDQRKPHKSKIIVFDFNHKEQFQYLSLTDLQFQHGQGYPFCKLRTYLQNLYMNPYIGRSIILQSQLIVFQNFIQKFRKDEYQCKIKKVDIKASQMNNFKFIQIFEVLSTAFEIKSVLVYFENRLIQSFDYSDQMLCGIIQIKPQFSVDICKTRIQNVIDQKRLKNHIRELKQSKKRTLLNKQPQDSIRSLNYFKDQSSLNRLNKSQSEIAQNFSAFQFTKKSKRQ